MTQSKKPVDRAYINSLMDEAARSVADLNGQNCDKVAEDAAKLIKKALDELNNSATPVATDDNVFGDHVKIGPREQEAMVDLIKGTAEPFAKNICKVWNSLCTKGDQTLVDLTELIGERHPAIAKALEGVSADDRERFVSDFATSAVGGVVGPLLITSGLAAATETIKQTDSNKTFSWLMYPDARAGNFEFDMDLPMCSELQKQLNRRVDAGETNGPVQYSGFRLKLAGVPREMRDQAQEKLIKGLKLTEGIFNGSVPKDEDPEAAAKIMRQGFDLAVKMFREVDELGSPETDSQEIRDFRMQMVSLQIKLMSGIGHAGLTYIEQGILTPERIEDEFKCALAKRIEAEGHSVVQ